MEPDGLLIRGKSELEAPSSPGQSERTDVSSSGKRRKATIPLKPFRLTQEEMIALGMFKGITAKSPKPTSSSKKLQLEPFRISEYVPDRKTKSNRDIVMPSGTIIASKKESGVKRRLVLPSTSRPKSLYHPHPIKTLQSPKKSISVKVSQLRRESAGRRLATPKISKIRTQQTASETSCSSPLLDASELMSEYNFKSPQVMITGSTPPADPVDNFHDPTSDCQDPIGLINEMISTEKEAFKNDQIAHKEKICKYNEKIRKYNEKIVAEGQAFEQRRATHEENVQKLKKLYLSIQSINKENDSKPLNTVEAQSPRTKAALKMFNTLRFDHPMTPKAEGTQHIPRRDLSMVRLGVMKECWLLQDTPVHK